jgi:arylsulfatase A-like enzyme
MKRIYDIVFRQFGLLLSITLVAGTTVPAQDRRPNIVFILTDDHRWDALGYFGNPFARTPELDALARSGTVFRNAFASTPICSASRASLLSGQPERRHRYSFQSDAVLDAYMDSAYPALLRRSGYRTAAFGKLGVKYARLDTLFDVHDDYDRNNSYNDRRGYFYKTLQGDTVHLTRFTGQQGVDFIRRQAAGQPFCLQLNFSAPHAHDGAADQYFWQTAYDTLFQRMTVPAPPLSDNAFFDELPEAVRNGFSRLRWTWRFDEPAKYQRMVKGYYRMIAEVDAEVGRIRAALREKGLDRNTIVVFLSDNGYFLGERQLADKWLMYEPSVRVPLIVMDPRQRRHGDVDAMALNTDVPATLLDIAGVRRPSSWPGRSLLPLVGNSPGATGHDTLLLEHLWVFDAIPASEGLRTARTKYFRYVDDRSLEYLYDLSKDPDERHNLARDPRYLEPLTAMRTALDRRTLAYRDAQGQGPTALSVQLDRLPEGAVAQTPQPIFQWTLPPTTGKQRGYQILVASSREALDENRGDCWDTRQVRSGQTQEVGYMGRPLQRGRTYHWKVRIWDAANRTRDYSEAASFRVE